jgi:hypothetical protein
MPSTLSMTRGQWHPEVDHGAESGIWHEADCAKKTAYLPQILHISVDARNKLV